MREQAIKRLALLLPVLALAACGKQTVRAPGDYDLSGTLGGGWAEGANLRLALVGTGLPNVVTNTANLAQTRLTPGAAFGVDLPSLPDVAGVYQVIAFDDADNDGTFDPGETFARNRQWLMFSPRGGDLPAVRVPEGLPGAGEEAVPAMTVAQGWNLYDRARPLGDGNPRPGSKVTGYDLSR